MTKRLEGLNKQNCFLTKISILSGRITAELYEKFPLCHKCGTRMNIQPVNDDKFAIIGGDFKSMWFCMDEFNCGYQRATKEDIVTVLKKMNFTPKFIDAYLIAKEIE